MRATTILLREPSRKGRWPWLAFAFLAWVAALVCVPWLLAGQDPAAQDLAQRLQPPSPIHLFGTDALGRDLFSRVVHGARASLVTAVVALVFSFGLSLLIGLTAGFLGGRVDRVLMAIIDVLLALPSLLLSLLIVSGLGTGPVHLGLAVGLASVPAFARVTRAEVLRISTQPFVEAAAGYGLSRWRILLRHILPHARTPLLTLGALELATMVLSVSALSFLGYGTRPPDPEWGNLIAEGREHFATAWWLTTLPGLVLAGVVLALHRVARASGLSGAGLA
ncbi:ABC transporter permease [Methylobacterium organophilum]|uniref:ABC transporter permease n=1 Tax=Methylobacterium organophilum TaxID=410 RepID=UPI001F136178|nr:ABC transporter permease [Methylobacterium organophilum]UMY18332.1 ABC transporter permease [Methylobacterium organophilum]